MPWRWIRDNVLSAAPVASGAFNMALDSSLLASVSEGAAPAIRTYRWAPACLSLGRNQVARGVYDPALTRRNGIDLVRRPTGGLAVLHDCELTYSLVAPAAALGGPRNAYRRIHEAIASALRSLGIDARLAPPGNGAASRGPVAAPCFAEPAGGEVMVQGGKLVGSAQRCERRTILQHGSILLSGRQARVAAFTRSPARAAADGSVALDEVIHAVPTVERLDDALRQGFARVLDIELEVVRPDPHERARATELEATYRDDAWTWRR